MDSKLFLLKLIEEGEVSIPQGTNKIEISTHDITFYDEDGEYLDCDWFENEQFGYEKYQYDFADEFTYVDFLTWLGNNPHALEAHYASVKRGLGQLAFISQTIQSLVADGKRISEETGAPFQLTLEGSTFDVRTLGSVDWNSSSMYC